MTALKTKVKHKLAFVYLTLSRLNYNQILLAKNITWPSFIISHDTSFPFDLSNNNIDQVKRNIIFSCDVKLPLHKHYIVLQHSFSNKATSLLNLILYSSTLLLSNNKVSSINFKDLITQKLNNNSIYYFDFSKNQYIKLTFHLDDQLAIEYIQNDNFLPEPDQECVLMDDCDPIHDGNQLDFIMTLKILTFMLLSEKFMRDFVVIITFFIIIALIIFIAR